jgi:hypothetical protein
VQRYYLKCTITVDENSNRQGTAGDTYNVVSGGTIGYLIQARDIGQVIVNPVVREAAPLDRAQEWLAIRVAAQWQAEVAVLGIDEQVPMAVHWRAAGLPDGSFSGGVTDLAAAFGQLTHRRLLILGGPGAGKTTLAMLMVLGLLRARAGRDPVPVLLPVGSWPDSEHFHTWLARAVRRGYPGLRPQDARDLVAARRVLPVLDGLDEVPQERQAGVLSQLNTALAGGDAVILTCRSPEYEAAARTSGGLQFAATLRAEPLSARAAADYLIASAPAAQVPGWQIVMADAAAQDYRP